MNPIDTQPDALKLAYLLEAMEFNAKTYIAKEAAAELRRLHAEVEGLAVTKRRFESMAYQKEQESEQLRAELDRLRQAQGGEAVARGYMRIVRGHTGFVVAETEWGPERPTKPGMWLALYTSPPLQADSDQNAPWLTEAHMLCTDHGIAPGNITDRIKTLRDRLQADAKVPPEYVLVPVEPTPDMARAGWQLLPSDKTEPWDAGLIKAKRVYRAMLSASPAAPTQVETQAPGCSICANGNDIPDGEWCRACGFSRESKLLRAVRLARGSSEPPTMPLKFSSPAAPTQVEPGQKGGA